MSEHHRKVLEASLEAAWLRTCGESGRPGKWFIPGGYVPVVEGGEVEVSLYPTYAVLGADGKPCGWSMHYRQDDKTEAWQWSIGVGWDDMSDDEADALEEMGACLDERSVIFHALGDHQTKPAVPPLLVDAYAYLSKRVDA